MDSTFLIYIRLVSYCAVMIITAVTYIRHCKANILLANFFFAAILTTMLLLGRIFITDHSVQVTDAILNTGVVVWSILHLSDFIQNGDKERMK